MKYYITLIILFFSNYCYGQYFEVSNTFSHWHVFGLTNEQKGDSVDLCVLDYNKTNDCINDSNSPSNDNSTYFEKDITPQIAFSKVSFGLSNSYIGGKNKPGFLKGRIGLSFGLATLSGRKNNTRIDGTGTIWGGEVQLQENRLKIGQIYPILGFRPILKYFQFNSHLFPVLITGSNLSGKYFERTLAKVSGSTSSFGGTYTFNISKKQSVHLDLMREEIRAKMIIEGDNYDVNNRTSSVAIKFDLSL